jgi:hypothetical protein
MTIQEYLFPEMNNDIEHVRQRLQAEPAAPNAYATFIREIRMAIARAPEGGLVAVGCSTVAGHHEIVDELLKMPISPKNAHAKPRLAQIDMPPLVTSSQKQIDVLFDRYFAGVNALHLPYKLSPLYDSPWAKKPQSRTESVIETLTGHGIPLVCITDAQNISSGSKRLSDIDRMLQQLRDISQRSKATHVLIGEMGVLWSTVSRSRLVSEIQVVMHPVYDPEEKMARGSFTAMHKKYQQLIEPCSKLDLATRYKAIMPRVGGDHRRFAVWLTDALCEAARQGSSKLEWQHLKVTAPRLEQMNDANRSLNAYLEYTKGKTFDFPDFDEPSGTTAPTVPPKGPKLTLRKGFEPNPVRDMVEKKAVA